MKSCYRSCDTKFPPRKKFEHSLENEFHNYKFRVTSNLEGKRNLPLRETTRRFWQTPDTLVEITSETVNKFPLPDAFSWKTSDVLDWIKELGFPEYMNVFQENLINGRTLLLVDASVLIKMNIIKVNVIQIIAKAIRDLYMVEEVQLDRSISLPPRYPDTHYKLFQIKTGLKYSRTKRTDLWRKMKLLRQMPEYLTHWAVLERWLKHLPPRESEMVGYAPRWNLYKVMKEPPDISEEESLEISDYDIDELMPPYYYGRESTKSNRINILHEHPRREMFTVGVLSILKTCKPNKYLFQNNSIVNKFSLSAKKCTVQFLFEIYAIFVVVARRSLLKIRISKLKETISDDDDDLTLKESFNDDD